MSAQPIDPRQALLDSLMVERFTTYRDLERERPDTPAETARKRQASLAAADAPVESEEAS